MTMKVPTTMLDIGAVAQVVVAESVTMVNGSTVLPFDDTIPQSTEGNVLAALDVVHTAKSATNKLKITVTLMLSHSVASSNLAVALFLDAGANAIAAGFNSQINSANVPCVVTFTHYMTAPDTSAHTYRVRYGSSGAGTVTVNGVSAGRIYGGVLASSVVVEEIVA